MIREVRGVKKTAVFTIAGLLGMAGWAFAAAHSEKPNRIVSFTCDVEGPDIRTARAYWEDGRYKHRGAVETVGLRVRRLGNGLQLARATGSKGWNVYEGIVVTGKGGKDLAAQFFDGQFRLQQQNTTHGGRITAVRACARRD